MSIHTIPGSSGAERSAHNPGSKHNNLEAMFIDEYLLTKGYRIADLDALPQEDAQLLKREACRYAALKLAEIEARSRFRQMIDLPD